MQLDQRGGCVRQRGAAVEAGDGDQELQPHLQRQTGQRWKRLGGERSPAFNLRQRLQFGLRAGRNLFPRAAFLLFTYMFP